ncbi:MAG: phosphoribosylanthranilate isomerase [Lachnospiraceae bacterium]|nr:phosphoribosylanthranilate isomerase [Lachnospiraceae bacterium]
MGKNVKVKICGLRSVKDIEVVNKYKPNFAGVIFAKSKRQVTIEQAKEMKAALDKDIKLVGVFMNQSSDCVIETALDCGLDMIQLHGDEELDILKKVKKETGLPVIKNIPVPDTTNDFVPEIWENIMRMYEREADYILFDTFSGGKSGGTGKRFNLNLLPKMNKPFFVAGGVDPYNVKEICDRANPFAVDVSSSLETDGMKDEEKIKTFFLNLEQA